MTEARGYLLALLGPGMRTLKQSMRIFSLQQRMKNSISSVMSAFNTLELTQSPRPEGRLACRVNEREIP